MRSRRPVPSSKRAVRRTATQHLSSFHQLRQHRRTPKPRTECCCQSVAVMIAAIVAPAGARSIATIRLCLVPGRDADFDEAGADLARDAALRTLREVDRVAALGLDLGLVTGFSEQHAELALQRE